MKLLFTLEQYEQELIDSTSLFYYLLFKLISERSPIRF